MNQGLSPFPLTGTSAVVTGGGRGVGATTAALLSRAGARVALVGRSEESLRATAADLPDHTEVIVADLTHPDAPSNIFGAAVERLGRIDILVNNAAAENFTAANELTTREADDLWALNARAPMLLAGLAAAHMAGHGGGSIVNIGSVIGSERSIANQVLYSVTKGGIDGLTRSLAAEWGPRGVRVNSVRPAVTRSDMSAAIFENPELEKALTAQYALGRLGEQQDVAEAVLFFAGPASSFVTGQTLSVDGGWITTLVH